MSRGLTAEQLVAIASHSQQSYELLEVEWNEFDTTTGQTLPTAYYRFTNAPFQIKASNKDWLALGDFLAFDGLDEQSDFAIQQINIALSGMNDLFTDGTQTTLAKFFNDNYIDRPIRIFRVFFGSDNNIIGAPILIFDGRMNKPLVSTDPVNGTTIGIQCSSQWADFERKNGRSTNDDEQQKYAPGDIGFQYAHQVTKDLRWGG
jgi:hypothetical protein